MRSRASGVLGLGPEASAKRIPRSKCRAVPLSKDARALGKVRRAFFDFQGVRQQVESSPKPDNARMHFPQKLVSQGLVGAPLESLPNPPELAGFCKQFRSASVYSFHCAHIAPVYLENMNSSPRAATSVSLNLICRWSQG